MAQSPCFLLSLTLDCRPQISAVSNQITSSHHEVPLGRGLLPQQGYWCFPAQLAQAQVTGHCLWGRALVLVVPPHASMALNSSQIQAVCPRVVQRVHGGMLFVMGLGDLLPDQASVSVRFVFVRYQEFLGHIYFAVTPQVQHTE